MELAGDGAKEIACRSRGTPRVANRLLKRVRDYAQVKGDGRITKDMAQYALGELEVDIMGLDPMDRKMLFSYSRKVFRRACRVGYFVGGFE